MSSLGAVRRLLAVLLAICAAAAVTVALFQEGPRDRRAVAAEQALPEPGVAIPRTPAALAQQLTDTTRRLRAALRSWDTSDPVPRDVTYLALHHQRMLRFMGARRKLADATIDQLPRDVRGEARDTVRARRDLAAIPRDEKNLPPLRVAAAASAADLRRHYDAAQRRFGIHWSILASINFVESAFGRVRSASEAGAQGPMQFLPSTWRRYGMGGDIDDPRDAILGAANYLHASGAPKNIDRALFAYNHSTSYVRAIRRFASRMRADERSFATYYAWQVFVRTAGGGARRLTGPGRG
jgi:membrane-bound lytic murein transglycosylase B